MFDAFGSGVDWAKKAKEFHGMFKELYTQATDPMQKATLQPIIDMGAGAFAGPLAVAGFATSLFKWFLDPGEPLQLSLELELAGRLGFSTSTPSQESDLWFYLPGRFSIAEAFAEASRRSAASKRPSPPT